MAEPVPTLSSILIFKVGHEDPRHYRIRELPLRRDRSQIGRGKGRKLLRLRHLSDRLRTNWFKN